MESGFWKACPEVPDELEFAHRAFWDLSASRSSGGMGVGSIPFEAIDRYAERYEVDDFEEFHSLIRAMDGEFVKWYAARMPTATPGKGGHGSRGP